MSVNAHHPQSKPSLPRPWTRLGQLAALALTVCTLAACATPPPASDPESLAEFKETNDPIEPTNRVFYAINNGIDMFLLRPVAVAYRDHVPLVVRSHTHNFLTNLGMPVQLFNDMLEAKPRRAGDSLMRLVVNTTIGVGGVFDVATDLGWPDHENDAGMTLALWGLPDGPFLFLPILGPSGPRDATGFAADIALSPFTWVGAGVAVTAFNYGKTAVGAVDARAAVIEPVDKIEQQALDPYATFRSLYRQHRQSQIDDLRGDNRRTVPAWFPAPSTQATKP